MTVLSGWDEWQDPMIIFSRELIWRKDRSRFLTRLEKAAGSE
jgi:hypothetical protein